MELELHAVRQINGDLRIDDGDEGPMLTLQFFDVWASTLTDGDKDEILEAVVVQMNKIAERKEMNNGRAIPDRKAAIAHTKAKSA